MGRKGVRVLNRYFVLVLFFLVGIAVAAAGDTITNMWGTVTYGWIDAERFGIQFQGSPQIREIERDWPKSALLITNHAHRLSDNLFAWQVRKSAEGQVMLVVPNDFTKAQSYSPSAQPNESRADVFYSEFQVVFSRFFEGHKLIAEEDLIEISLSWGAEHRLFSFSVPAPPSPSPATNEAP